MYIHGSSFELFKPVGEQATENDDPCDVLLSRKASKESSESGTGGELHKPRKKQEKGTSSEVP